MFDTHCHLNFKAFNSNLDQIIAEAKKAGITHIIIPGTDLESSKKAVEIAQNYEGIYASVGIHPHHLHQLSIRNFQFSIKEIEQLLSHPKVVAVGETGIDKHLYTHTKHQGYQVNEDFLNLQKKSLTKHIKLAIKYKKSLILHNREATKDLLTILTQSWNNSLSYRTVFHCCEPDLRLLEFAKSHNVFIGIDGDITYSKEKQEFIKKVPLELLVLETDSPFLTPEPLKSQKVFPNMPMNLKLISEFVSKILNISASKIEAVTDQNSKILFGV